MYDQIHRFLFDELSVRGAIVRLDEALARNLRSQDYPAPIARLLTDATTAVGLLTTTVKIKGRIGLQFQSQGPIRLLLAECTDDLGVRSVAQYATEVQEGDFSALMAQGMMALSLIPEQGQQYQGVVPMDGDNLAACIEHYFQQSEQLATRIFLFSREQRSVGLMIQALPGLSQHEDFHRIVTLAQTLTADEAFELPVETMLHRLYHEEQVRLFEPAAVRFQCRCSKERCQSSLRTLAIAELEDMLATDQGANMTCDFCSETYRFNAADIQQLLQEKQSQTH